MFSQDELHQARSVPALKVAERHAAKLKKSGAEWMGPCPHCGGVDRLGIIRLSPDDEVETGLHLIEGLESAFPMMMKGYLPMWAAGSTVTMAKFPVLDGIEWLTVVADNDIENAAGKKAGQEAAREVCQRWADAGRKVVMKTPKRPGEDANDILRRRLRA